VRDMNLAVDEKFTLVAIPVLAGALLRVPMGFLADLFGAKRTGIIAQLVVIAATAWVCYFGLPTKLSVEVFGLALGIGGASFAVALPQASRWYPPQYQGVVMGIAGAGNMGVVLDTMFAPSIAEHWGWQAVFGVLLVPMLLILAYYAYAAKDAPGERKPISLKAYGTLLRDPDSRWFMFFYFITFGGFVGLANALPLYFSVQYHVSGVAAGLLVSLIVAFGSGFRPVGGLLADRIGGIRSLSMFFGVVVAAYLVIAFMPEGPAAPAPAGWALTEMPRIAWVSVLLFSIGVLALGMASAFAERGLRVLVVAVELCSLSLVQGDRSRTNLVASVLFGDGAAAAVVLPGGRGPRIEAVGSHLIEGTEGTMGFSIGGHGLQILLQRELPAVLVEHLPEAQRRFLSEHGRTVADIGLHLIHPGGRKILDAYEEILHLDAGALAFSRESLRRFGNLSSVSILTVLELALDARVPVPEGKDAFLVAIGPGLSIEMMILDWEDAGG